MNAQLAEEEVNGRGGLVVKRVSLREASIVCRVLFHPTYPSPPPVLWISRWAWFGFGAVGLSIACGTCPTDTVIDSVSATWRTERPGVWRGWQRGHGGAEKEGFLLSGWVKRTDKPKLDHLEPHECTWQERAFTFGMGDRNKDRVY